MMGLMPFFVPAAAETLPLQISDASYQQTASGTSHAVTLPASAQIGDIVVVLWSSYGGTTAVGISGTGWSGITSLTVAGNYTVAWVWKKLDGADALNVGGSPARVFSISSLRITGNPTTVDGASTSSGAVTNWDAPNLAPAPGSKEYCWIAAYTTNQSTTLNPPSGYTYYGENKSGTNNHHYFASKVTTASSANPPGATNVSSAGGLGAFTFAVG